MRGKNNNHLFLFVPVCIFCLFVCGCAKKEPYFKYRLLKEGIWRRNEQLTFVVDSVETVPGKHYNISVELMHNKQYPYQNLWLIVSDNFPLGASADTLEVSLCADNGTWLGSGTAGLLQLSVPYKEYIATDSLLDSCRVNIRHYMRDESLNGIERVGVRIIERS